MPETFSTANSAETIVDIRWTDLTKWVRASRRRSLLGACIGGLLGLAWSFLQPNQYTAQVVLMPELSIKNSVGLGNLGSLAGLAGINLDNLTNSTDALRPDLYPNVVQSVPFVLHLLQQPVVTAQADPPMSYSRFLERQESALLLARLTSWLPRNDQAETALPGPKGDATVLNINRKQENEVLLVNRLVTAGFDKKTGLVALVSVQTDPVVAATVARLSADYLTNYITTYRTEKARQQATFLAHQLTEARQRYQQAEYKLSAWRDQNRNLFLSTARLEGQRLDADYTLAQALFDDLSRQYEQANVRVQQETPVFKILEPARIPTRKSGPKRTLIIIGLAALGLAVGFLSAISKQVLVISKQ